MFSFFKREATDAVSAASSISPWELSEDEQWLDQIGEYTYSKLEGLKVNLKQRKFIWRGGRALDIGQVAKRLHKSRPDMPVDLIEDSVMSWLEEAYEPEGITDGDMEEQAQLDIEAWLEAHDDARQVSEID